MSEQAKWTPGPLTFARDAVPDWHEQYTVYVGATGERVATVFGAANAALFAEAGAMADLIEKVIPFLDVAGQDAARAILARVKGGAK